MRFLKTVVITALVLQNARVTVRRKVLLISWICNRHAKQTNTHEQTFAGLN